MKIYDLLLISVSQLHSKGCPSDNYYVYLKKQGCIEDLFLSVMNYNNSSVATIDYCYILKLCNDFHM